MDFFVLSMRLHAGIMLALSSVFLTVKGQSGVLLGLQARGPCRSEQPLMVGKGISVPMYQ